MEKKGFKVHRKEMNRLFLGTAFLAATASCAPDKAGEVPDKPNVVIIYADDIGYGDLGCYGAKAVKTHPIPTGWRTKGFALPTLMPVQLPPRRRVMVY